MMDRPMTIETVCEKEKIEPLLVPLKQLIGDNGFITLHKVEVVWLTSFPLRCN
jgi:PII-like signaling protein